MIKIRFSPILVQDWRRRYEDGATIAELVAFVKEQGFKLHSETMRKILHEGSTKFRKSGARTAKKILLS